MNERFIVEAQPLEGDLEQDLGRSGRWIRHGNKIIVLPKTVPFSEDHEFYELSSSGTPAAIARVLTYSTRDVIDNRISVPAQHSLVRLSKKPATSADAVGMLEEVKAGRLAGIFCVNWKKPAERALKFDKSWWTVIPPSEDAILMLDPGDPLGGPPLIAFRRELDPDCGLLKGEGRFAASPSMLDAALLKAWSSYKTWQRSGRPDPQIGQPIQCSVMPQNGDRVLAELQIRGLSSALSLSNVIPPLFCEVRTDKIQRRLRLSVWADPQFVKEGNIKDAQGILDDVTLLRTLSNDGTPVGKRLAPLRLTFDKMFLQGSDDTKRRATYRQMVAMCHSHGIQILAGYGIVIEKLIGARFNAWLRDPKRSPTFGQYAAHIVHFLRTLSLDPTTPALKSSERFDGLGIDIETLDGDLGNQFTEFCQLLARRLGGEGMILAVAAGGMISEEHAFQGPPDPRTGKRPKPLPALPSAKATQYKMAVGFSNFLIRPMAYDINLSGRQLAEWHKEIIEFAIEKVGLLPSQFQLGVKTVHGGLNIGITEAPTQVIDRCRTLLRPNSVGLIIFALGRNELWNRWKDYNTTLNTRSASAGTPGEPLQVPINETGASRLTLIASPGAPVLANRSALRFSSTHPL